MNINEITTNLSSTKSSSTVLPVRPTGLLARVQTISEIPYYVKLLLYGPGGVGKTRFVGEGAPNPVFMDVERSGETFRRIPELSKMPIFIPKNFEEMFKFSQEVVSKKAYETIVVDTIGRAQTNQVRDYLIEETSKPKVTRSKYLPLWGDYRVSTNMLDEFFMFLQEAPIHVIFIAHDRVYIDPDSGQVTRITPDLTPSLSKALTELINVVAYMDASTDIRGQIERKLIVNPINKIEAKNRLNIQENMIKNPNFSEIFLTN